MAGVGVGPRRLDQHPMGLPKLHTLPLRYVKLGGEFSEQAAQSPGALHLLQAIVGTGTGLGIQVVETDVVNTEAAKLLRQQNALTLLT